LVDNPIEIISRTRKRLAWLAAVETLIRASLPISVTLAAALLLDQINALAFAKLGYHIEPDRVSLLRNALFAVVLVELGVTAALGWRAWVRASGFLLAAERIDSRVGGRQEILTLATLADPAHPEAARMRSALFPMLWRRVLSYLDMFELRREFRLKVREPLQRSSVLAVIAALVLTGAVVGIMTVPDPVETAALRLRQLANSTGGSATAPRQLAMAARDIARDLENPALPPEQKIAELQALKQQLGKSRQQNHSAQSGNGNSSDGSSGKGNGGSGNGGSGNGSGSGSGQGNGPGQGSASSGGGTSDKGGGKSNGQQTVELRNDISKAQAMLEQQAASGDKSQMAAGGSEKGPGIAPKPGNNPNQPGNQNQPNGTGAIQLPQPSALANNQAPSGGSPHSSNKGGSMGDTHLGEFPKGGNYQRYYKLGEGGHGVNVRDARYVTFRLPTEIAGGGGSLVSDSARPTATTPYTNAPLKEEGYPVTADEQQLVPPRYRELIR
jgi:hypothetical protein